MKHIIIIALLSLGLHHYTHAQDSYLVTKHLANQKNANSIYAWAPDTTKKTAAKVHVTHIQAPKHKYGKGTELSSQEAKTETGICFPLSKDRQYNVYDFVILLQDNRVVTRYKPYFDRHHLKFSGYVWEVVIKEMLADADPEISRYVVLRSEADKILIKTTKYKTLQDFPDYMCHIFSNLIKFDDYLKRVDTARVPGY